MGALKSTDVTDDLRASILAAWKMPAGAVSMRDRSRHSSQRTVSMPALEQVFSGVDCKYFLHPNDNAHVVDVTLALEQKR